MERIKGLLQNKKIQAAILIVLICILFIAVLISNRSGQKRGSWSYKEVSNSDAQETTIITEEITREIDAQIETDANGKIFSILVEEETIDLSSDEIETEAESDGSVTYKVGDKTQVVVNKDGTAKVIKTETVTKVVAVNPNKNNQSGNNQSSNNQAGTGRPSGNTASSSSGWPTSSASQNPSNSGESSSESSGQGQISSSSSDQNQTATDPSEESTTKPSSEEDTSGDTEQSKTDAT